MAMSKVTIIKVLELIVVCVLIGLHYYSFSDGGQNSAMITMGAYGGYLIILAGVVVGALLGSVMERRIDMFFSIVGCILFIVTGALIIDHFTNMYRSSFRNTGIAKGAISLGEGVLFLVDGVLAYRGDL